MSTQTFTRDDVLDAFVKGYNTVFSAIDSGDPALAGTTHHLAPDVVREYAEKVYPRPMRKVPREIEVLHEENGKHYRLRVADGEVQYSNRAGGWHGLSLTFPARWGAAALVQIAELVTNPTEEVPA